MHNELVGFFTFKNLCHLVKYVLQKLSCDRLDEEHFPSFRKCLEIKAKRESRDRDIISLWADIKRPTDRQTSRQIDRQTDRRQTDRQTDRKRCCCAPLLDKKLLISIRTDLFSDCQMNRINNLTKCEFRIELVSENLDLWECPTTILFATVEAKSKAKN